MRKTAKTASCKVPHMIYLAMHVCRSTAYILLYICQSVIIMLTRNQYPLIHPRTCENLPMHLIYVGDMLWCDM